MTAPTRSPRPRRRRRGAALAGVTVALALLAGCASSTIDAGSGDDPTTTAAGSLHGLQRDPPLDVSGVTLPAIGADGTETPFTTVARPGHVLFVSFGYTSCPDVCPTTLADLRTAKAQLGADGDRVDVAFVTVDPDRDTAEVLPRYLGSFFADAHGLRTTDQAALDAAEGAFLASSSVKALEDGTIDVTHSSSSWIVDEHGTVLVEWPFGVAPDAMASDLRLLLGAASSPTGSTAPAPA